MPQNNEVLLDEPEEKFTRLKRRMLMPWWMKFFAGIFLLGGVVAIIGLVLGIFGINIYLSLYGLESTTPYNLPGAIITALFLLKGVVAFAMFREEEWAMKVAFIDAGLGIAICIGTMLILPAVVHEAGHAFTFRFEIVILALYLYKLIKMEPEWLKATKTK